MAFHLKNPGDKTTSFDALDIGPFKVSPELMILDEPQKLIWLYDEFMDNGDLFSIGEVLKTPVPEEYKKSLQFYSAINYERGIMCGMTLRIEEADKYFEEAWKYCPAKDRWIYSYNWASNLINIVGSPDADAATKGKIIHKIMLVLDYVLESTKGMKFEQYHRISVACMKAFLLCYLDEGNLALELFNDLKFHTLTKEEIGDEELPNFLTYIVYGQAAAIELKSEWLMRNLCSLVDAEALDNNIEPRPIMCMQKAGLDVFNMGYQQMNIAFGNILKLCNNYAPEFPNFRRFAKLQAEKDSEELENFIPYFE